MRVAVICQNEENNKFWWKAEWLECAWLSPSPAPSMVGTGQKSFPDPVGECWGLLGVTVLLREAAQG